MSHVLHLGDCLQGLAALADKSVDHVITDPPYSDRVHRGAGAARAPERPGETHGQALSFGCLTYRTCVRLAHEYARLAERWIIVFSDEESVFLWKRALERAGAKWCVKGTWIKEGAMPRMDGTRPAYGTEAICIAHARQSAGKTRWNGGGKVATYSAPINWPGRWHATEKPIDLMTALVSDFTDPGELICDPFAGSGTTGVACKRLGRRFIGWEKDPKFYAAAVKRIDAARQQYELLPRGPKPKQEKLLP